MGKKLNAEKASAKKWAMIALGYFGLNGKHLKNETF